LEGKSVPAQSPQNFLSGNRIRGSEKLEAQKETKVQAEITEKNLVTSPRS